MKRPAVSTSTAALLHSSLATLWPIKRMFFNVKETCNLSHRRSPPPLVVQRPLVCQGLPMVEASRSHLDTPHSVGLPWMSDRPFAGTFSRQHTTLIRDRHSCTRRDSNPNPKKRATDNQHCRPRVPWIRHTLK